MEKAHSIEETLLDLIKTGREKLTEKLFFELLRESEDYLKESPFREKITEWQERVQYIDCSASTLNRAKRNLKKVDNICSLLPPRDRGRPPKVGAFKVFVRYQDLVNEIHSFFDRQKKKPELKLFLSAYPAYKDCFKTGGQVQHRTAKSIAFQIICKRQGISIRQLWRIIANESKVTIFCNRKIVNNAEKLKKTDIPL